MEEDMLYRLLAFWDRYRVLTTAVLIVGALGLGAYLVEHLVAQ
jgi:hypothetical protein